MSLIIAIPIGAICGLACAFILPLRWHPVQVALCTFAVTGMVITTVYVLMRAFGS